MNHSLRWNAMRMEMNCPYQIKSMVRTLLALRTVTSWAVNSAAVMTSF